MRRENELSKLQQRAKIKPRPDTVHIKANAWAGGAFAIPVSGVPEVPKETSTKSKGKKAGRP